MTRRGAFATRAGLALAGALAFATPAPGQNGTGRVVGRVLDRDTGEPLVGGLVVIESSGLGNVAREDGSYFIDRIPAGVHRFRSEYLGYVSVTQERRVAGGGTTTLDFQLAPSAIESNLIVAVVERPPIPTPEVKAPRFEVSPIEHIAPPTPQVVQCTTRVSTHGAYIQEGRWQMHRTVGNLECGDPQPLPCETPVVSRSPPAGEGR